MAPVASGAAVAPRGTGTEEDEDETATVTTSRGPNSLADPVRSSVILHVA